MRPRNFAWLFVSAFIAFRPMLKPLFVWSIARTLTVLPLYVSAQQVPHWALPQPEIWEAPPMYGNLGRLMCSFRGDA
jgi:hypothetical protein